MNPDLQRALTAKLLALADDELILGHRNSEWCGHAPILEEDIAFTNIALDEIGHAAIWYGLLCDLTGDNPDNLIFWREAAAFRNAQMVELPKGDWAFSMLRQYLFDAAEKVHLAHLAQSAYRPAAEAAAKIQREELYHYRHTSNWTKRLGLGTEESHRRMQDALDTLWFYTMQLFAPQPGDELLIEAGYFPHSDEWRTTWEEVVVPFLQESGLRIPKESIPVTAGRDQHSSDFPALIADLQQVARINAAAEW